MTRLQTAHTAHLDPPTLRQVRELLEFAFGSFSEDDWDHTLGGIHAVLWDGDTVVAHGSVVQRRLVHGRHALRTAYVEGVAVHPDHRRRGYASQVMADLEAVARGGYDLAALSASAMASAMYQTRGWPPWRGPLAVLTPYGTAPTPGEAGSILVLPGRATVDLDGELTCDWRDGDVW